MSELSIIEQLKQQRDTALSELDAMKAERDAETKAVIEAAGAMRRLQEALTAAESERYALKERVKKAEDEAFESKRVARDRGDMIANIAEQRDALRRATQGLLDNYKENGGKGLGIGPIMQAKAALAGEGEKK